MKLEDVKVGQILKDKFGNKYKVTLIKNDDLQSVSVKCVEFKRVVCVGISYIDECDDVVLLLNNRSILLSLESPSGRKIANNLKLTTFSGDFKKIEISTGSDTQSFLLCGKSFIDKIDVTLFDLEEDVASDYLTEDNIKLGMKVVDGLGNEYTVEDYVDDSVQLSRTFETSSVDGESCIMSMKTWILFYDENKAEKHLITTKNFRIVEGN